MTIKADYEARPFSDAVWSQMKNLRRERHKLSLAGQSGGGLCVTGFAWGFLPLLAGFGNFGNVSPGTDFTRIAREGSGPQGLSKYVNLAEAAGLYPVCGAIAAHLGQIYAGTSFGGNSAEKMQPQFVFQPQGCHAQYKGGQLCASVLGLPMIVVDAPRRNNENGRRFLMSQLLDVIELMQKNTGLEFNDEKFIEATRNDIYCRVKWAQICMLMKAVPSPMSYRQAMSLRLPLLTYSFSRATADYMDLLYAEMQQRVREGISGSPFERKRLAHEGLHPLYRPEILRWPEEYGAAFSMGEFMLAFGSFLHTPDGHIIPGRTLAERGFELRSREDGLRALVELHYPVEEEGYDRDAYKNRITHFINLVNDWKIDGVMLHMARRCAPLNTAVFIKIKAIRQAGIPLGTYEASEGDPKEWNESRVRDDFSRFFESLGLARIASLTEIDGQGEP
jgi:benzoyl-CoA reductase/2-hydroxyglutaryl-CoA dehydratase subunit BcrC/BadD/HgdB